MRCLQKAVKRSDSPADQGSTPKPTGHPNLRSVTYSRSKGCRCGWRPSWLLDQVETTHEPAIITRNDLSGDEPWQQPGPGRDVQATVSIVPASLPGQSARGMVTWRSYDVSTVLNLYHRPYARPSTRSMPARTRSRSFAERRPTRSSSRLRSMLRIWETFATESLDKPVRTVGSKTFPGASANRRLLVNGTITVVAIRLALNSSPWTTTTGRRKPGPDPSGSSSDAQQTSPWLVTIRNARASGGQLHR